MGEFNRLNINKITHFLSVVLPCHPLPRHFRHMFFISGCPHSFIPQPLISFSLLPSYFTLLFSPLSRLCVCPLSLARSLLMFLLLPSLALSPDGWQRAAACCGQANYLHNYDLPLNHMILYLGVGN